MAASKANQYNSQCTRRPAASASRSMDSTTSSTWGAKPGEISPSHTLSQTLRETLGLTGTKISCDEGACGCCTVIMDGKAVLSCKILTIECDGKTITTIEGLRDPKTGALDPLQQAFIDHTAFQCGFCTPGMIMTARPSSTKTLTPRKKR